MQIVMHIHISIKGLMILCLRCHIHGKNLNEMGLKVNEYTLRGSNCVISIFSSPEHEVLMVSYCDQSMSVVRRPSSTICFKS